MHNNITAVPIALKEKINSGVKVENIKINLYNFTIDFIDGTSFDIAAEGNDDSCLDIDFFNKHGSDL